MKLDLTKPKWRPGNLVSLEKHLHPPRVTRFEETEHDKKVRTETEDRVERKSKLELVQGTTSPKPGRPRT